MALQIKETPKYLPPFPKIDIGEMEDFEQVKNEMRKLKEVVNRSAKSLFHALRSSQNAIDSTFNSDGTYKNQITQMQIAKEGLTSHTLNWEVKGFFSSLAFDIKIVPPTQRLGWSPLPFGAGVAYSWWHTMLVPGAGAMGFTTFVNGFTNMPGGVTVYSYIDTKNDYSPFTIQNTLTMTAAIGDGKILLCQSVRDGLAHPYRYAMWGSTLWRGN